MERFRLTYLTTTINFTRAPRYFGHSVIAMQQTLKNAAGSSFVFDPVVIESTVEVTWPAMSDDEIAALKTFMFTTVPVFEYFTMLDVGNNTKYTARFGELRITEKHLKLGWSEVTVPMVVQL